MDAKKLLEENIVDLRVGTNLVKLSDNKDLESYMIERYQAVNENLANEYGDEYFLAEFYAIDLVLLVQVSIILNREDAINYFKSRLNILGENYPFITEREDVKGVA